MTDLMATGYEADVAKLVRACQERLNPSVEWEGFPGYPGSLAQALIDAIWSTNVRYPVTRGVITRYRNERWSGKSDQDGLPELLGLYESLGGVDSFIDTVGTRNRVSTQPDAILKGEAVFRAAQALEDLGIDTADQFRQADGTPLGAQAKEAWCAVPGQRSGISWRYLRMLVGLPDVKPDRMVIRFTASALGVADTGISPDYAVSLVRQAAEHFEVDQRALDHEIWAYQSGRRAGHDQVSERDQLAAAAQSFVGGVFPALEEDHVIPRPQNQPYIHVGRDYFGGDVRGPEYSELEALLQTAFPDQFGDPLTKEGPEFPETYIFSLLEGAVARCALAGDAWYEADTAPVQDAVKEFIQVLDSPSFTLTCCRAISHLTTEDSEPVTLGEVTVYPENSTTDLMRRAARLVPAAPSAFNQDRPHFYDPPHALVAATATTEDRDTFGAAARLSRTIDQFLLVARLLYAGTHESTWQVTGASTLVSRLQPIYHQFHKSRLPNLLMQRVVKLSSANAAAITTLSGFIDAAVVKRDGMAVTSFDIGLRNYIRSYEQGDYYDRLVDLATALEATLTGSDGNAQGVGLRLRTRAAALLWTQDDSEDAIYKDVRLLYDLRSKVVHGARISRQTLTNKLSAVSTVPDSARYGVAFSFALDRLRDLVRRSFLARLCLASGDDPLWKFEVRAPVDVALSDDADRELWRQSWRDKLASLGVADAADAAVRAIDPMASKDEESAQ